MIVGSSLERSQMGLQRALARLGAIDGVVGTLIATRDGVIVASAVPDGAVAESLAAATAVICGRLAEVTGRLGLGAVDAILADTVTHSLQFMPVGGAPVGLPASVGPGGLLTPVAAVGLLATIGAVGPDFARVANCER